MSEEAELKCLCSPLSSYSCKSTDKCLWKSPQCLRDKQQKVDTQLEYTSRGWDWMGTEVHLQLHLLDGHSFLQL